MYTTDAWGQFDIGTSMWNIWGEKNGKKIEEKKNNFGVKKRITKKFRWKKNVGKFFGNINWSEKKNIGKKLCRGAILGPRFDQIFNLNIEAKIQPQHWCRNLTTWCQILEPKFWSQSFVAKILWKFWGQYFGAKSLLLTLNGTYSIYLCYCFIIVRIAFLLLFCYG